MTKGVGQAQRSLKGFETSAKKSQGVMSGLSSTASGLGLAVGAGGLALGISKSIAAFKEQEKAAARVTATLKTLGINTDAMRKKIDDVTKAQSKLSGFQDEDLQDSFGKILRVTKDVNESFRLNALAMDISRGSGKDLNVVATAIAKVADGNVGALGRYGVKAQKGATATDVLALAQKRYAGQAKEFGNTTAGAAEKANAQINELEESVGKKLAPAMNEAAGATLKLASATGSFVDHAGGIGPLVAGGAGFGAFKLLAPTLLNAGDALGHLGQVAGKKGAGTSIRVLGSALAESVSPMTAVGIGAGLAAAGIYELWHTSESADQAVAKFNGTLNGLNTALDQSKVAKDNVNSAKDFVKSTNDSVVAAKAHASALHADIVQLSTHKGTTAQVAAATTKWHKALDAVVPLVHQHQAAVHNLTAAQKNLKTADDGVTVASGKQNSAVRDVTDKVLKQTEAVQNHAHGWREYGKAGQDGLNTAASAAGHFASLMDKAAANTRKSDTAVSKVDSNLAGFARRLGRIPSIREVKLVTKYTAQGLSLDQITSKIASLHSKTITLTTQTDAVTGRTVKPKTTKPPKYHIPYATSATGSYVAGSYSAGDRVPAMLSGEEAVLNPRQISMVDSGMTVMGALDATGAPTIGQGGHRRGGKRRKRGLFNPNAILDPSQAFDDRFAKPMVFVHFEDGSEGWIEDPRPGGIGGYGTGGKPGARGGGASTVSRGGKSTVVPSTVPGRVAKALDRKEGGWEAIEANAQLAIATAVGDGPTYLAQTAEQSVQQRIANDIQAILLNPAKALGIKGATLTRAQRTQLIQERTAAINAARGEAPDDATESPTAAAVVDTGPTPDQQAQIDQANQRAAVATRAAALSDATLGAFSGASDLQLTWSRKATTTEVASAATMGLNQQSFVQSSVQSIRI